MYRLTGAALLLVSSLLLRQSLLQRTRLRRKTLRALAESFRRLASCVRSTLTPLPRLLGGMGQGTEAEPFFRAVESALAQGGTLKEAWAAAAEILPIGERERETAASAGGAFDGDEQSVCAALLDAAALLEEAERAFALQSREESRVTTAVCLGGGFLVGIVLL